MNFINKGSDYNCVKSLNTQGLVQKDITVQGKHGTYVRKQWVSPQANVPKEPITHKEIRSLNPKTVYLPKSDCGSMKTRAFSYSDIVTYYSQHKRDIKVPIQQFIKENYFISGGDSHTSHVYKTSHGYTKERQKLHRKLIQNILDSANSPPKGQKPVAVLMGGGSASGKGTIRKTLIIPKLQEQGINVGISDCDDIKEQLPEYEVFKNQDASTAALRVHTESMDVSMQAVDDLIKNNKNLMFDSTMKSTTKMMNIIQKLRKAGYEIKIVGADVPLQVAFERSQSRSEQTGRKVPEHVIRDSHGGFSSIYPELIHEVDTYSLYDNSGKYPVLIQDERGIHRPDLYRNFVQKGKIHTTNKTLSRLSQTYGVSQSELQDMHKNGASLEELEEYLAMGLNEED